MCLADKDCWWNFCYDSVEQNVYTLNYPRLIPIPAKIFTFTSLFVTCYLVPSKPPVSPNAVNLSGPHTIHVSWEPVPEGFVHGILLGYRIFYTVISIAGEDVRRPTLNTTTNETALSTTLSNLLNYAVYDIQVTAFTVKGDGAISHRIIAGMLY